jgi:plasmid stabilization system protein ParE
MSLRVLDEAREGLKRARAWYDRAGPGLGARFVGAIEAALDLVEAYPNSAPVKQDSVRAMFVSGFPYRVLYLLEGDDILVIAFAHERRRMDYWRDRLA